jgi:hypothetical protein
LDEVYFHGIRPYVMGCCVIETHKPLKTSIPVLIKPLQLEANDIQNQRLDNVKFVLNKRWLVARGRQVDVQSLVRNAAGGVTLTTDPKTDVVESNWPDVTSSAYVEQDRVNADMDDLVGNFSPSTKVANNAVNDTLGGSKLANQSAGVMTDYLLRTFIETWYEPVLRQLVLLLRYYETDETILRVCGKKAQLFPRYEPAQIGELITSNDVDVIVNVGMGASDPQTRLQKLLLGTNAIIQIINTAPPGMNVKEMAKEIYSMVGYRDGARFLSDQQDPRLLKAMEMVKQLQGMVKGKQMELETAAKVDTAKIQSDERIKAEQIKTDRVRVEGDLKLRDSEIALEQAKLTVEAMSALSEVFSAMTEKEEPVSE